MTLDATPNWKQWIYGQTLSENVSATKTQLHESLSEFQLVPWHV